MIRARCTIFAAAVCTLPLGACSPATDLGQTCPMTKPCTPGPTCDVLVSEVPTKSIDYIALGSPWCDDQVCVRTAYPATDYTDDGTNAVGYCTHQCINDQDCAVDYLGQKGMVCAQLLPSDAFLSWLQQNDPTTYTEIFGTGGDSRYCILARTVQP